MRHDPASETRTPVTDPLAEPLTDAEWKRLDQLLWERENAPSLRRAFETFGNARRSAPFDLAHFQARVDRRIDQRHTSRRITSFFQRHAVSRQVVAALGVFGVLWGSWSVVSRHAAVDTLTYVAQRGERLSLSLPNGTHIVLAPGTALSVHSGRHEDAIDVVGEALFSVAHHPSHSLTVHTGAVSTHILGTQFDVMRYVGDAATRVVVTEGRVRTGVGRRGVVLTAGEMARVTDSSALVGAITNRDAPLVLVTGRLVFDSTTVAEMLTTLGRWYGYEFRMTDSLLATQRVSAEFTGRSPTGMLNALKSLLDVSMTFERDVITLRPNSSIPAASSSRRTVPTSMRLTPTDIGR